MQTQIVSLHPQAAELDALIEKTRAYLATSKAQNTIRGYKSDWVDFSNWVEGHELCSLPAAPATVALYLAALSATKSAATLARRLNSIAFAHKKSGYAKSPTYHPLVRETVKGIRREIGTAQKVKQALLTPDIERIVACCPESLAGLRDRALILVSFAAATRRSETAALRAEDVAVEPEGMVLTIRKSKTDQEAAGRKVGIPFGAGEATCPVRALRRWQSAAGIQSGSLFRAVDQAGRVSDHALHADSIGGIVKRAAARCGLQVEAIGGHSLRAGHITQAARNGVPEYLIRRQSGHRSSKMLDRYIRLGEMFTRNAAAGLGL